MLEGEDPAMKRIITYAIAIAFIISLFVPSSHAWRREYRSHRRGHYQSYTIKNPDGLKNCQATCQKKYGIDGAKCKEMDTAAKKICRQSNRSCNAECWNKYH